MPTVNVNGANIWYELTGSGPYLVQISGAVSGHEAYGPLTPLMAQHFTVIDYDHRGYGFSDRPVQRYDVDVWADDLVAMLDALGVQKTHVHGGSMGAFIAVNFAVKYPDRVDRLILGGGAAKTDYVSRCYFRTWQTLARTFGLGSDELMTMCMTTAFSRETSDGPQGGDAALEGMRELTLRNASLHVFLDACQAMIDCDVRDRLHRITAPTLLMVGEFDQLTPLHQGPDGAGMDVMHERIAGSKLAIVPGCGHGHLFEAPEASAAMILDFLLADAEAAR